MHQKEEIMNNMCTNATNQLTPKKEKIDVVFLIIDDQKDIANLTEVLLKEVFGVKEDKTVEVHTLRDGSELEVFLLGYHERLDLIIMDWEMPNRGGKETYLRLREYPNHATTPVLFFSGAFTPLRIDYLTKTFDNDPHVDFVTKGAPEMVQILLESAKKLMSINRSL